MEERFKNTPPLTIEEAKKEIEDTIDYFAFSNIRLDDPDVQVLEKIISFLEKGTYSPIQALNEAEKVLYEEGKIWH